VVQNFSKALRIRFISFNLSTLDKGCWRFDKGCWKFDKIFNTEWT